MGKEVNVKTRPLSLPHDTKVGQAMCDTHCT